MGHRTVGLCPKTILTLSGLTPGYIINLFYVVYPEVGQVAC